MMFTSMCWAWCMQPWECLSRPSIKLWEYAVSWLIVVLASFFGFHYLQYWITCVLEVIKYWRWWRPGCGLGLNFSLSLPSFLYLLPPFFHSLCIPLCFSFLLLFHLSPFLPSLLPFLPPSLPLSLSPSLPPSCTLNMQWVGTKQKEFQVNSMQLLYYQVNRENTVQSYTPYFHSAYIMMTFDLSTGTSLFLNAGVHCSFLWASLLSALESVSWSSGETQWFMPLSKT